MTTSVTILNNGPNIVSVVPVDDKGEPAESERSSVSPGTSKTLYI